jgi:eukaryotic-like serine/threonine-protein kinase
VSLETGQKLGRYRIERLIAQGGMAEVYRADQELAAGIFRPAALKVIRVEYSESPDFREMFLDEARVACTLSHPNIVHIYEVGDAEGRLFMAMELVTGETLATIARTLRERDDRLSDEALFAVGISTCSALAAVHALKAEGGHVNLVHRDVSPHNLLLASDGTLKLIDFGIAKAVTNRNLTNPGVTKGKAGYFSPEQAMGKALDGRSDLFSLGVTLYKLASGKTPFDQYKTHHERNSALVRGQWTRLEEVTPGLPKGIYEVVGKAMALKPADRYADAREMREALEKAAFAAGIPVRQDALFGYVSSEGEVSGARPSASTRVKEAPRGPVPQASEAVRTTDAARGSGGGGPRRMTERVAAARLQTSVSGKQARRRSRAMLAAVFGGAVLAGSLGTLLLTRATDDAKPAKVVKPAGPTATEPLNPPLPPPDLTGAVEPVDAVVTVETPPNVEPTPPAPTQPVAPPRPRPQKPKPVAVAVAQPAAPPRVEEPEPPAIPAGIGKLVVSVRGSDVAQVVINSRAVGPAPQVLKDFKSGRYTIELALANGRRSVAWKGPVLPDATTTLLYDPNSKEWELTRR